MRKLSNINQSGVINDLLSIFDDLNNLELAKIKLFFTKLLFINNLLSDKEEGSRQDFQYLNSYITRNYKFDYSFDIFDVTEWNAIKAEIVNVANNLDLFSEKNSCQLISINLYSSEKLVFLQIQNFLLNNLLFQQNIIIFNFYGINGWFELINQKDLQKKEILIFNLKFNEKEKINFVVSKLIPFFNVNLIEKQRDFLINYWKKKNLYFIENDLKKISIFCMQGNLLSNKQLVEIIDAEDLDMSISEILKLIIISQQKFSLERILKYIVQFSPIFFVRCLINFFLKHTKSFAMIKNNQILKICFNFEFRIKSNSIKENAYVEMAFLVLRVRQILFNDK